MTAPVIRFSRGSEAELKRLLRLFILTEPYPEELLVKAHLVINVGCNRPRIAARLTARGYISIRMRDLVQMALLRNRPYAVEADSNYYVRLSYQIKDWLPVLPRERMNAEQELKEWLRSIDEPWEPYLPADTEKIL